MRQFGAQLFSEYQAYKKKKAVNPSAVTEVTSLVGQPVPDALLQTPRSPVLRDNLASPLEIPFRALSWPEGALFLCEWECGAVESVLE
jgi:hypothetical protein